MAPAAFGAAADTLVRMSEAGRVIASRLRSSQPHWLLAAAFLAYIPLFASLLLFEPFSGRLRIAAFDMGSAIAPLAAGLVAIMVALKSRGRQRRGWAFVALGSSLWGAGDLVWFGYEVILVREPFPSPADALYLGGYIALFSGIVVLTGPRDWRQRIRVGLDAAAVAVAATAFAWHQLIGPLLAQEGVPLLERIIAALYPICDMALIFAVVIALPRRRGLGDSGVLLCFCAGLVMLLAADVSFAYMTLHESFATGSLVDLGWFIGYCLLGLAAALQAQLPEVHDFEEAPGAPNWRQVLPLFALPVLVWWVLFEAGREGADRAVLWLGLVAVCLVVARQVVSFFDAVANAGRLSLAYKELSIAHRRLRQRATGLEADLVAEHARATLDVTTGALSRLGLEERLHEAAEATRASGSSLAIVLVDVDLLKEYNDRYGHAAGDEALRSVAAALQHDPDAIVGRFGGDEFLVLLPGTRSEGAELYLAASEVVLLHSTADIPQRIEFSAGYAIYPEEASDLKRAFRLADERMYAAKSRKRAVGRSGSAA